MPEAIFPLLALGLILALPIVAILTAHQRRMAEILNQDRGNQAPNHEAMLVDEIARLRDLLTQQSIAIDNLTQSQKSLESRLGNTETAERLNA